MKSWDSIANCNKASRLYQIRQAIQRHKLETYSKLKRSFKSLFVVG